MFVWVWSGSVARSWFFQQGRRYLTGLGVSPYKHFSTKTSVNESSSLVHLGNQAVTRSIKFISRSTSVLWSAICLKIMIRHTCGFFPRILAIIPATRYMCVFLPRILAFFPVLWGFYSQLYDYFLTNVRAYICAPKRPIYMRCKQACVYGVTESRRISGTELYCQQKNPSCTMELKSDFDSLNQA